MAMSSNKPIFCHIDRASFTIWSKDDIKKISVKKITESKSYEKRGVVHPHGLYSPALGPIKRFDFCPTCGLAGFDCPGHYGHIELSVPVYHPMLVQVLYQLLNKCCLNCFHFRLPQSSLKLFLAQLEALNNGFDHLIDDFDEIATEMTRDTKAGDDSYIHVALEKKLISRIQEEKEKIPDFDCQRRPQQRSIVERLSKLFRNFINGTLVKPAKVCPNCNEKKISMSLHQQSVIVVGMNSSKPIDDIDQLAKSVKKKTKKKKISPKDSNSLNYLNTNEKKFLTPIGANYCLKQLWKNEKKTMQRIFHFLDIESSEKESSDIDLGSKGDLNMDQRFHPVDLFFVETILVPPTKFRPPMSQHGYSFEGPRTAGLSHIMKYSVIVQDTKDLMLSETDEVELERLQVKLQSAWKNLQTAVNINFDNEMDKYGKDKYPGLKQLIDKKEGLFRKNMMGKRVNFAARSVISPDPNISVDQVGVPLVFAKKLTYPEPVTPMNVEKMRQTILNGPDKHPGANSIVYEDGVTVSLNKESVRQACAQRLTYRPQRGLASKKDTPMSTIVNRHMQSGDVLLFNRQPTLHKPSIMAFRARVIPNEKGFRLHYANCKSFNADFDGDEMNAHLPQSEVARSEAYNIASVNHQYLVPKDGSPLGGLIQDHVVAVCILTSQDKFLDRERYFQLVYGSIAFLGKTVALEPPTIIRPTVMWTGKQVITTIIKNCIPKGKKAPSLKIKSKITGKVINIEPEYEDLTDCHVLIRNGELIKGYMDKTNVGATQYGLIHTCYELYGGETSSNLMSAFGRLSTVYLQSEGFTLGIRDILLDNKANLDRKRLIMESATVGDDSAKEALGIEFDVTVEQLEDKLREAHSDRNPLPMKKLDASMKSRTDKIASSISSRCLPRGLISRFPDNNLQMMIQSGAKGGTVNALQISCLLGQIELEGRRVPLSMSGRSLPSFKPYDTSPKAGGFVTGRFLTGIQPQEFFFHCMAGREGLIDTAVKTSRSGYLQRCLIKHLEGITVHYDQTVRDSCGSVIQFLYGEDGLDITKSQMLKEKALTSLVDNYDIVKPSDEEVEVLNKARENYEEEVICRIDEIQNWLDINGKSRVRKVRGSGFLDFLEAKLNDIKASLNKPMQVEQPEVVELGENAESEPLSQQPTAQQSQSSLSRIGSHHHDQIFEDWYALSYKEKRKWNKFWEACPDPLTALMNPASHFGVVPERLDEMIERFVRNNPNLIADSASLIGCHEKRGLVCDEIPELSKCILNYITNESCNTTEKPKLTKHEFYNLCYISYMKMLAQPGEAVGLLAAQSIGEPSTQMTLNTFHFAGRGEMNVTLGIPRLREILMTASAKIGTPSMDLPVLKIIRDELGNELDESEMERQVARLRLELNPVRLWDVVEYFEITDQIVDMDASVVTSTSTQRRSQRKSGPGRANKEANNQAIQYEITFNILPSKYYNHEFLCSSRQVIKFIEEVFVGQLTGAMHKRLKQLKMSEALFDVSTKRMNRVTDIARGPKPAAPTLGENDPEENELDDYNAKAEANEQAREADSSSDDDDDADGDNTTQRIKSRRNQDLDYEEPEAEDLDVGDVEAELAEVEENDNEILADDDKPASAVDDANNADGDSDADAKELTRTHDEPTESTGELGRPDNKHKRRYKVTICVDLTTIRLDMNALVESEMKRAYIHRVGNIERALVVRDVDAKSRGAKCDKMIKTEGVSLLALVKFSHILDLNAIYSNDIHAIANTYGIEAASQAIRREMANVFAVYGIQVDPRHLSLIADYMTYSGSIRGMNRMSMEASASPFQQMSFESTLRYLKWATILGLHDDIKSPSAALVFGRPTRGGTGSFSLLSHG